MAGKTTKKDQASGKTHKITSYPKTIGHYRILEKLGEGGMGVVYKAEDTKLKRTVALKFLPPELTRDKEAKQRFLHEARAASALDHPNICTIFEVNETDEGRMFIAMAYYEGETLKDKIASGLLPMTDVVDLTIQIAQGLQEAHERGIAHRDIKSANIIITDKGVAKILDFGLAKLKGQTRLTKDGTTLGTVNYMSPEQASGEEMDHRSDIWSLGVVLYEMFTGQLPFKGEYPQAVLYSILNKDPISIKEINPDVPKDFENIVSQTLAKRPADRYQTSKELLEDLKAITQGLKPLKTMPVRKKAFDIRKVSIFFISLLLTILFAFNIGDIRDRILGRSGSPARTIKLAVLPFANLTGDPEQEYLSDGFTQEMISQLGRLHPDNLSVIARSSVMRYKKGDTPIDQIGRELGVDYVLEGSTRRDLKKIRISADLIRVKNQTRLWGDTYERKFSNILKLQSEVALQVAEALALKLLPAEKARLTVANAVNPDAHEAYLKGKFHMNKFTRQDIKLARQYFELSLEKDPDYALAYLGIAGYWGSMTYFGKLPREIMPKWKAAVQKGLELDSSLAESHYAMAGFATWYEFDWNKAEKEFRLALKLNPNYAHARIFYGLFLTGMGRFEEAKTQMKAGIELDPINAMHQGYLGFAFYRAHQFDQAIEQFQKSLALQPDFTDSLGGLFHCYHQKKMYEQAIALKRRTFEITNSRDLIEALGKGYKVGGYKEAMRQVAGALVARSNRAYSIGIAQYYTYAEEKDLALDWLETAYQERMQNLVYLNVQPKWDPLRNDPRFQNLLRKMKFPVVNKEQGQKKTEKSN